MNLTLSSNASRPAEEITIKTNTIFDSFVSIIGVDQSVAYKSEFNEINEQIIIEDIKKFVPSIFSNEPTFDRLKKINAFVLNPVKDCTEDYENIRNKLKDDGFQSNNFADYDGTETFEMPQEFAYVPDNTDDVINFQEEMKIITESEQFEGSFNKIRNYFPDVWIYDDFIFNNSSQSRVFTLPDSITTWKVTGLSLHRKHGIAIAAPEFITSTKQFFLDILTPSFVRVGEVITLVLRVHSSSRAFDVARINIKSNNQAKDFQYVNKQVNGVTKCTEYVETHLENPIMLRKDAISKTLVLPLKPGVISMHFELEIGNQIYDQVCKNITVLSDGFVDERNHQFLIELNQNGESKSVSLELPIDAELIKTELSLAGNLFGPFLKDVQEL